MKRFIGVALFAAGLGAMPVLPAAEAPPLPPWIAQTGSPSIEWRPWSADTLAHARAAGRSVYVFVGSDTQELARATVQQTFSRPETIAWLNENFTCIAVDADDQPVVAAFARHFLTTVTQQRGWPAHLWLTPDLLPYEGAGYLPATEEWGRPGFLKSARTALDVWQQDPERARALGAEAVERMRLVPPESAPGQAVEELLTQAIRQWMDAEDKVAGGFGAAPKVPEPELWQFLSTRGPEALAVARRAANAVVGSALHDRVNGGFYRRTLDAAWQEPYRQKSLLDQARLARALFALDAVEPWPEGRAAGEAALAFALRSFRKADGGWSLVWDETAAGAPVLRGRAPVSVVAWLAIALLESRSSSQREFGRALASTLAAGGDQVLTAADGLAIALALHQSGDVNASAALASRMQSKFFAAEFGLFLATGPEPVAGLPGRFPALPEPLRPEVIALQVPGVDRATREVMRNALRWMVEYDPLPSGDVLSGLAARP